MPSAGGVCPPTITFLRNAANRQPTTSVDSTTLVKLQSDTHGCKIYFTTDGTKPSPFKRKVAGQEITFKYFAPFTLKRGKRTIKAIAVSRDGLQESSIVTKSILVDNIDQFNQKSSSSIYDGEVDVPYSRQQNSSPIFNSAEQSLAVPEIVKKPNSKLAWSTPGYVDRPSVPADSHYEADIPDIPFHPTNYSGTQINMVGVPGNKIPFGFKNSIPGLMHPTQYGFITEQMIQGLNPQSKPVTIGDIRNLLEENKKTIASKDSISQLQESFSKLNTIKPIRYEELPFQNVSPGQGDTKAQIMHIFAHLLQHSKADQTFAMKIAQPQLGKLLTADITDEGDSYKLTLVMEKPGRTRNVLKVPDSKVKATKMKKPNPPPKTVSPKMPSGRKTPKPDPYYEMGTEDISHEGTLKPYPDFNPENDCQQLQTAMSGLGTDEDAIIRILANRSNSQRQEIIKTFKSMFGKDLVKELKGELSGNLKECVKSLCMKPSEFDAVHLRRAMKNFGTDEDVLIEILCTRSNGQIKEIISTYNEIYNRNLEDDIVSETSGHFQRLLVSMVSANRSESNQINITQARQDAKALYEAGEKKWGTDETKFHTILVTCSFAQLRATFEEYAKISQKTIEEALKSELSGDFRHGMLTIVQCVRNKAEYFAQQLRKAMKGLGTDDDLLIRVIVSRCEIDMVQIKEEFLKITNNQLEDWISDDISGYYEKIILALISKRMTPDLNRESDKAVAEVEKEENEEINEEMNEERKREKNTETFPTVVPYLDFNSKQDCEILYKAFKGFGTDEKAIIKILACRSSEQRLEIRKEFKGIYGKDLIKELKSELSGHFKDVTVGLCMSAPEFDATQLKKAVKGIGTNEKVLTEIICSRNNEQLKEIKIIYQKLFKKNLEDDVSHDTSGDYKRILTSLLQCRRKENKPVNLAAAKRDVQRLYEAGESKLGTDEDVFIEVFCTNNFDQLLVIFEEYKRTYNKDIEDMIKAELSGNAKESLLAIVECCRDIAAYFASILYRSMKGLGTDDDTLIRVVISRSEIDMERIKEQFKKLYNQKLQDFVSDDISGDYKEIILTLLNGNKQ